MLHTEKKIAFPKWKRTKHLSTYKNGALFCIAGAFPDHFKWGREKIGHAGEDKEEKMGFHLTFVSVGKNWALYVLIDIKKVCEVCIQ